MRRLSLRWLLFITAFVTLTGAFGVMTLSVLHTAEHQLSHYAVQRDTRIAHRIAHELVAAFRLGGMSRLKQAADGSALQWGSGLVIRGPSGRIVAQAYVTDASRTPAVTVPMKNGPVPLGTVTMVNPPTFEPRLSPVLRAIERTMIMAAALGLSTALLVSFWVGRSISEPFRKMAQAVRAVAAGRRDIRVPVAGLEESRSLAEDFNNMAHALAESEQQQRQLVADMAHELRTPLSILLGYAQALEDGVAVPGYDPVVLIREETRYLARLTEDLQTLALADAQELRLFPQWVEFGPWLTHAVASFEELAAQHQLSLTVVTGADLPFKAFYDPDRLRQALGNYLHNALKYTPAGGQVTVMAESLQEHLTISVVDTGIGVDAADLPHLFDRLYRADRARARDTGGTGLGLAMAKRLVELSGGTVGVCSTKGEGSTFWLQIPFKGSFRDVTTPHG